jgi:hypothetical protein
LDALDERFEFVRVVDESFAERFEFELNASGCVLCKELEESARLLRQLTGDF